MFHRSQSLPSGHILCNQSCLVPNGSVGVDFFFGKPIFIQLVLRCLRSVSFLGLSPFRHKMGDFFLRQRQMYDSQAALAIPDAWLLPILSLEGS